jgi:hypothetical protein
MRQIRMMGWWLLLGLPWAATAQIDPIKRDLIQLGYNQPMEGQAPVAGYVFYYHNEPNFIRTNTTWRLALAPVYVDTELGFAQALSPRADFAIGAAGGGFADSYSEIDAGQYRKAESFDGHGGELSASIFHRFNPGQLIPLSLVLRGAVHYATYEETDRTAKDFELPDNQASFNTRAGLRWGGIEPTLFPELAMELSAWYESVFRSNPGHYGYNNDREVVMAARKVWVAGALSYTLPESKQNFFTRLIAGTSMDADRLSAYRLGGYLPLSAEYPLSLPGYYHNEFSARQFALWNVSYLVPIAPSQRWNLNVNAASAAMDYLPGTRPSGNLANGVGAGILYRAPSDQFRCIVSYGYGFNAVRDDRRGASSISLLLQIDLERSRSHGFEGTQPDCWRGWNWLMGR